MDNRFVYKYEFKYGIEKPKNNATHISFGTAKKYSNNPEFLWQSTGETNSRGQTKWRRATGIQLTPEYKAFLKAQKQQKKNKSEFKQKLDKEIDVLALLVSGLGISRQDLSNQFQAAIKNANNENVNMTGGKTFKRRRNTKRHRYTRRH